VFSLSRSTALQIPDSPPRRTSAPQAFRCSSIPSQSSVFPAATAATCSSKRESSTRLPNSTKTPASAPVGPRAFFPGSDTHQSAPRVSFLSIPSRPPALLPQNQESDPLRPTGNPVCLAGFPALDLSAFQESPASSVLPVVAAARP